MSLLFWNVVGINWYLVQNAITLFQDRRQIWLSGGHSAGSRQCGNRSGLDRTRTRPGVLEILVFGVRFGSHSFCYAREASSSLDNKYQSLEFQTAGAATIQQFDRLRRFQGQRFAMAMRSNHHSECLYGSYTVGKLDTMSDDDENRQMACSHSGRWNQWSFIACKSRLTLPMRTGHCLHKVSYRSANPDWLMCSRSRTCAIRGSSLIPFECSKICTR